MLLLVAAMLCMQKPDAGLDRSHGLTGKPPVYGKTPRQLTSAPSLTLATAKPPRELITVDGTPGLTAFIDKDQVGLHDGKRLYAWTLPAPLQGDVGTAFTVPGRPDQFIACRDRDCVRGKPCRDDRAYAHERQCVWLAPKCGAAALLADRFIRVEASGQTLLAQVLAHPLCLPDGPEPRWLDDNSGVLLGSVLQGELETHACAAPTWARAMGATRWNADAGQLEQARDLPRCDGGG
jgi:hypothetical protein